MKTHQQHSMLHSRNSKGFIITLDALIAAFLLILVLIFIQFFTARALEDKLSIIQPLHIVSDAVTYLDHNSTLQTKDKTLIQNTLQSLLPSDTPARIQIIYSTNETIDIGEEIPKGVFIAGGKRYFQTTTGYGVARYWVWPMA